MMEGNNMDDLVKIDVNGDLYHWIREYMIGYTRASNNFAVAMNRITILWILTLIMWWFK